MPELELHAAMANAASISRASSCRQCASEHSGASRARRGAGAQRPVITRRVVLAEQGRSLCADESGQGGAAHREDQSSQLVEPRCARGAATWLVIVVPQPRSWCLAVYAAARRRFCAVARGVRVRPNHSLQPTVIGVALGPRSAIAYPAPRGPSATPLPAAELERWASSRLLCTSIGRI